MFPCCRELHPDQITPKEASLTLIWSSCLDSCPFRSSQSWASLWFYEPSCFSNIFPITWGKSRLLLLGLKEFCYNDYAKHKNTTHEIVWGGCGGGGGAAVIPNTKLNHALIIKISFFLQLAIVKGRDKIPPSVSRPLAATVHLQWVTMLCNFHLFPRFSIYLGNTHYHPCNCMSFWLSCTFIFYLFNLFISPKWQNFFHLPFQFTPFSSLKPCSVFSFWEVVFY